MRVLTIDLDDEGLPETITVQMTRSEAAFLATATGQMSDLSAFDAYGALGAEYEGIYNALAGDVFNRFWDNGVDGVSA